jgi:hypothetical protein
MLNPNHSNLSNVAANHVFIDMSVPRCFMFIIYYHPAIGLDVTNTVNIASLNKSIKFIEDGDLEKKLLWKLKTVIP